MYCVDIHCGAYLHNKAIRTSKINCQKTIFYVILRNLNYKQLKLLYSNFPFSH